MTDPNSSFSRQRPSLQLAWDSTSMGLLKECPRKYYLANVYGVFQHESAWGWSPRQESVHLTFGLLIHAGLERYDHARASGQDYEAAVVTAVRWCLKATWNKTLNRPWASDDSNKNRYTFIRTIVWYLDQFKEDPIETVILANGKPAVELSFRFDLGLTAPTGEPYLYCGHMDKLGVFQGSTYVVDKKTTKSTINQDFFDKFSPHNQFSGYTFASKIALQMPTKGLIVDAMQIAVSFSRFQRGFVYRTEGQLEEWYKDLRWYIAQAEAYSSAGYWPQNDQSCDKFGGCPFRGICGKSPEVRDQWLRANFVKRVWDPLQVRGDI